MIFMGTLALWSRPREQRPALVNCGISVLTHSDPTMAPFGLGLPPATTEEGLTQYSALKQQVREEFGDFANATVNRNLLLAGGKEIQSDYMDAIVTDTDLYLQFSVPSFEYPRAAMPESVRFVGAMLPPPTTHFEKPEWWGELKSGRPVVVVTQGTVANMDLGQLMGPALAGLATEDVLVIAATGGPSVDSVPGPKPKNARIVDFVPFDKLLPYASVLVTNGGFGAINHALSLGIPVNRRRQDGGQRGDHGTGGVGRRRRKPEYHHAKPDDGARCGAANPERSGDRCERAHDAGGICALRRAELRADGPGGGGGERGGLPVARFR
jgi:hypothetical protein